MKLKAPLTCTSANAHMHEPRSLSPAFLGIQFDVSLLVIVVAAQCVSACQVTLRKVSLSLFKQNDGSWNNPHSLLVCPQTRHPPKEHMMFKQFTELVHWGKLDVVSRSFVLQRLQKHLNA